MQIIFWIWSIFSEISVSIWTWLFQMLKSKLENIVFPSDVIFYLLLKWLVISCFLYRSTSAESASSILSAVDEIEDNLYYFSDVVSAGIPDVGRLIMDKVLRLLIFPLILPSFRTEAVKVHTHAFYLFALMHTRVLYFLQLLKLLWALYILLFTGLLDLHYYVSNYLSRVHSGTKSWGCDFFIFTLLHFAHSQNQRSGKHSCCFAPMLSRDLSWRFWS